MSRVKARQHDQHSRIVTLHVKDIKTFVAPDGEYIELTLPMGPPVNMVAMMEVLNEMGLEDHEKDAVCGMADRIQVQKMLAGLMTRPHRDDEPN